VAISRREFIEGAAAISVAARLDGITMPAVKPRIAVIGAGAFGGWTALHLRRLGADVVLVDAWGPGHTRSSSGGETRVIRSIYGRDRVYVEMVRRAYELWDQLDPSLHAETGVLWMNRGDDAYVRSSLPILQELGFPVDQLTLSDAAKRYPQIDFRGVKSVWLERRAGALSARRACAVVRDAFVKAGGTYRTMEVDPRAVALEADAYVYACGPWLGKLFPDILGSWIRPTRQEVYYFGVPAGSDRFAAGHLPIWIDFGERIFYGIPDLHGRGFKVADDTRGAVIDPSSADRTASPEGIARARQLLVERFPELAKAPLVASEVCQYENSPDGHLIIDRHPAAKNVWLVGGGSGHGFKLSPAVGEMVALRILAGKEVPELFRLDPRRNAGARTQFEL
jgi:glycine/D-amino acid oxidase-like deaminating enzyme